ncbi:Inhibitor of apoptosis-promoting Bax1 family protein [Candida albicans]|uniref:Inhibitor of apoptosis-promoting Bax1 family protein n=1 Tax=Candida albicans TaxID=5476 RepID=A0A8H6BVF8_CANAX|nr:Inhibitor of apoptosis-promoting Bax1 family protein [Candida albicans]
MSSYTELPQSAPPYSEGESGSPPRQFGDNIPDDFKYSVSVASCELPLRQLFIRKVYSLLTIQLMGSVIMGFIIRSSDSFKIWAMTNTWLLILSFIGSIGFMIGAFFKARSYPINLILLGGFTICESYTLGVACAFIESSILIEAILLTLIIFIGLTIFAFQTKYDFISWQGTVGMMLWGLIGWGFVMMFIPHQQNSMMENVYSFLGALIFSIYIIIDTQQL